MKDQIEIVKDIADGMIGIGGIPSNEEFYAEFDMRVRAALHIHDVSGSAYEIAYPKASKFMENADERLQKIINKLTDDEWETLRDRFADFFVRCCYKK